MTDYGTHEMLLTQAEMRAIRKALERLEENHNPTDEERDTALKIHDVVRRFPEAEAEAKAKL